MTKSTDIPFTIYKVSNRIRGALGEIDRRVSAGFLRADQLIERAGERLGDLFEGRDAAV